MRKLIYLLFTLFLFPCPLPSNGGSVDKGNALHTVYSAVIVGSGPGALTSAIYLQRAGIDTLVIEGDTPGGAITQSPSVHNWPGEVEISGEKLIEKIRYQAESNGATFVAREVTHIDLSQRPFALTMRNVYDYEDYTTVWAKTVLIATGSKPKFLGIPGESGHLGYWTRGVYSCAVCDGCLYKDKTVAVIGGGDSAIIEADYLSNIAKKVYVILRSGQFRTVETLRKNELVKRDNVEVLYNTKVCEILGDGKKVTHLNLSSQTALPIDGVFVAIGSIPNTQLFDNQLELDEHGYIRLIKGQQASVRGVFAVGDVVDPVYKQAVSAAGDGAKAALEIEHFLAADKSDRPPLQQQSQVVQVGHPIERGQVEDLADKQAFYDAVSAGSSPLVVNFYSPHCSPCRQVKETFQELADQYGSQARFLLVDVTQFPDLAEHYGVYSLPTLMVFDRKGRQIKKAMGLTGVQKAAKKLDRYIGR